MATRSNPRALRFVAGISLITLVALTACSVLPARAEQPGQAGPGAPGGGGGAPPASGDSDTPIGHHPPADEPPVGGGALRVAPEPGIVDARPHAWDHIDVSADGRTLTVYYHGGVQDCYGLAEVRVDTSDGISITVLEGTRPGAGDRACIAIALLKAATVTLDEPLVLNPAAES